MCLCCWPSYGLEKYCKKNMTIMVVSSFVLDPFVSLCPLSLFLVFFSHYLSPSLSARLYPRSAPAFFLVCVAYASVCLAVCLPVCLLSLSHSPAIPPLYPMTVPCLAVAFPVCLQPECLSICLSLPCCTYYLPAFDRELHLW